MPKIDLEDTRVLTADESRTVSSGAVTKPDSYNYRTMQPEPHGLYCEEIFGKASLSVATGANAVGVVRRQIRLEADERKDRWGHIDLTEPIPHPLRKNAVIEVIFVAPPAYRKFIRRSAEEARAAAMERRTELLAMINDDTWVGRCDDGTDRPDNLLIEEGLDDEAAIRTLGPTWEEPLLNILYRNVLNDAQRVGRLHELHAPEDVVREKRRSLASHLERLFEELSTDGLGDEAATLRALMLTRGWS